jgi:hypothetical protein
MATMWQQMICVVLIAISPLMTSSPSDSAHAPSPFVPGGDLMAADDASPAFTPDGNTVYFMRGTERGAAVMESRRVDGQWSAPMVAPFSGRWRDGDPAMAPDGSFLVFASNRPANGVGQALDTVRGGKRLAGQGMNLWQVERRADGWSEPVRLPDIVNTCTSTFAPSIAEDHSIYYIGCSPDGVLRPLRSVFEHGQYQPPYVVTVGDKNAQIRDVAIAPDRSFMVFSIKHEPSQPYRLAIAFHTDDNWSTPQDLGDAVNGGTHNMASQLGCDHRTLYFSSDRALPAALSGKTSKANADHMWRVSLAPWLARLGDRLVAAAASCMAG